MSNQALNKLLVLSTNSKIHCEQEKHLNGTISFRHMHFHPGTF